MQTNNGLKLSSITRIGIWLTILLYGSIIDSYSVSYIVFSVRNKSYSHSLQKF